MSETNDFMGRQRLRLFYRLEFARGVVERELPFVIGAMADLTGNFHPPLLPPRERKFIRINLENFDAVLAALSPGLQFEVNNAIEDGNARICVNLRFSRISDFEPRAVAGQIGEIREMVVSPGQSPEDKPLNRKISRQLDAVMKDPLFQSLESTWRGLRYLLEETALLKDVQVRVLNISKNEVWKDLVRAVEISQSHLYRKICEDELEIFGGTPYSILVGDYEFDIHLEEDITLLEKMSDLAAAAHAPFIAAPSPASFGCRDFEELFSAAHQERLWSTVAREPYKLFRERESARYIGLVLPRVLLRSPHVSVEGCSPGLSLEGTANPGEGKQPLWGRAAYPFALIAAATHSREGWCAGMGLPSEDAVTVHATQAERTPIRIPATEIRIGKGAGDELAGLGFIPLVQRLDCGGPEIVDPRSCALDENASLGEMIRLRFTLAASRFAHYLNSIVRDTRGCFTSKAAREDFYNSWIRGYVAPDLSGEGNAEWRPLRSADMHVLDYTSQPSLEPGKYQAVANLVLRMPALGAEKEILCPARILLSWTDS